MLAFGYIIYLHMAQEKDIIGYLLWGLVVLPGRIYGKSHLQNAKDEKLCNVMKLPENAVPYC